jgi:hypothetical protein
MRVRPNYSLERGLWSRGVTAIAEVDEVGVGALAGPVVAAAVILAPNVTVDGKRRSRAVVLYKRLLSMGTRAARRSRQHRSSPR